MHLVLHLHWRPSADAEQDPTFLIWAETSESPQPVRQRGRLAVKPRPKPHPFAVAEGDALRRVLSAFNPNFISAGSETLTLQLPSTRTGPLPSPQLAHPWELDRIAPRLAPWTITGLRLPAASAVYLLGNMHNCVCPEQMVLGEDMHYWRKAYDFVLEILAKQYYVPGLRPPQGSSEHYRAVWRSVLEGTELDGKSRRIAEAMPPLSRSEPAAAEAERSPLKLLRRFVDHVGDHLIRIWGVEAPHRVGYLHNNNCASAWLKALLVQDGAVRAPASHMHAFAAGMRAWQRNLAPIGDTSFAIALELKAPPKNGENGHFHVPERGWQLDYLLQARDEPALRVSAEQVWQSQEESLVYQQRRFERPQEKLLTGLGQAANIFDPIERSLQHPAPIGVDLTTAEVYEFLRKAAPALSQSGFSLVLPPWWEAAGARLGLRIYLTPLDSTPPDVVARPASGERPIAYRWELVLGDAVLTQQVFTDLVALRSPLVQKEGRWLRLDPEQIEAAARFLKRESFEGRMELQQALRLALGLDDKITIAGLPVEKTIPEGWLPDVIATLRDGDEALRSAVQPHALQGALRPYQNYGYAWMHSHRHLGLGACLADDMGLGKSVQAIALLLQEQAELGELPAPTLLICPTSLLGNWYREIERFAPRLRVLIHHGVERPREDCFAAVAANFDIVLTSYTLARRDAERIQHLHWYGLILDEAQKIKNPKTQVAQAVNRIPSAFRLALTGTPVENRLTELWSLFNFLNKGYLGSQASFNKHFAVPIERYQDRIVTTRLQRMVKPFILRRLKSDPTVIEDLPERLDMKVYCTLSDEQAELYQQVVEAGLPRVADLRGRARRIHVFNLITRLKQILNHPVQYLHQIDGKNLPDEPLLRRSGKLDRLTEMLDEILDVGEKALVFTQYAEMGHLLQAHLRRHFERRILYLYGSVPAAKRQQMIARFQDDPHGPSIFVLTLKTGGLGLNLTAANHVFHFDRWWNPAVENQASDRAFRIGQTRNVQIHKFITAGTLEEGIDDMIERKQGLAEAIIGTDESWITKLSDEELTDLFELKKQRM